MGNIACSNYYFQEISFKPEWFSQNSWNIDYNYLIKKDCETKNPYPYLIDKGIIQLKNTDIFKLLISKKLLIDLSTSNTINIPLNFIYNINKKLKINMFIIFSKDNIKLSDILDIDLDNNNFKNNQFKLNNKNKLFYSKINFDKNKLTISNSFSNDTFQKNITSNENNKFLISLENNIDLFLIHNKLVLNKTYELNDLNYYNDDSYDEKYVISNIFGNENNSTMYLSIFIYSNQDFKENNFFNIFLD